MTTGERIKELRKQRGINAEKLADLCGLSPATIYRYEKGEIEKIDYTRLISIASALGTTPAHLLGIEDCTHPGNRTDISVIPSPLINSPTVKISFGEKLKQIRQYLGMNQVEFSAFLGTTKQNIYRYEKGDTSPTLRVAAEYADRLGVSLVDLCDESVTTPRRVSAPLIHDPAIEKYYALDPADRARAEAYMDGLLASDKYQKKETPGAV